MAFFKSSSRRTTSEFFRFRNEDSPDFLEIFLKKREFDKYELKVDIHGTYMLSLTLSSLDKMPEKKGLIWIKHKQYLPVVEGIVKKRMRPSPSYNNF